MTEERDARTGLYRNTVSYFGALVAGAGILLTLLSLVFELAADQPSPYLGIFTFLVFPALFTLGALAFLYGMRRESLRRRREGTVEAPHYPRLDLNDPVQRKWFGYAVLGGLLVSILLALVAYKAFHYTESVRFCGTLCHTVMKPEYTAYLASPHARVRCVDCHVGEGVEWFVKAKISGLRQVVAVVRDSYPRPIPTPIENLRPARETCEQCHWPAKFFGTRLHQNPHFRYDEGNTAEQIGLGVKTGGGGPETGGAGIHWHMIVKNRVVYAASDRRKQEIPYFEVRDDQGNLRAKYADPGYKGSAEELAQLRRQPLDCIDCHNRPTHIYHPPDLAVDRALASGLIPRTLPWVKKVVVDALVRDYPSNAKAHEGFAAEIGGFYREKYPDVFAKRKEDVDKAIAQAAAIYDRGVFPEMKVNWLSYPSNIGHRNWPGCFRCHDGKHVSETGKALGMDCSECHTLPVRSALMPLGSVTLEAKGPWHPVPLEGKHASIPCSRCHIAGLSPSAECGDCHKFDAAAPMMGSPCRECHRKAGEALPVVACRECHPTLYGLHKKKDHAESACKDCHKPHAWSVRGRDVCLECHEEMKEHNAPEPCAECHAFRKAGR